MKNIIDTWVEAGQVESEGLYLLRFNKDEEETALVSIELDANGNLQVWDFEYSKQPIFEYSGNWDFAPLEIR